MTSTETFTDVTSLVDSAFENLECIAAEQHDGPHSGGTAAFYDAHGCSQGWICRGHLKHVIEQRRAQFHAAMAIYGRVSCLDCGRAFISPDEFEKVWVL